LLFREEISHFIFTYEVFTEYHKKSYHPPGLETGCPEGLGFVSGRIGGVAKPDEGDGMSRVTVEQLLMAGAHFGHLTRRWNPKMKPYIFMAKNDIYIIDLKKTQQCIDRACNALADIVANGDDVLLVGTKKQAKDIIRDEAKRVGCPYVTERWLGGMLTNFATIRRGLKSLSVLEKKAIDGTYEKVSKKERMSMDKEKGKLDKTLGGIRDMKKLPGALFIVDIKKEHIAVAEAHKLGIPILAIVDTNVDPDPITYPIPANDDAFKSIGLITRAITDTVLENRKVSKDRVEEVAEAVEEKDAARKPMKRTRRRPPRPPQSAEHRPAPTPVKTIEAEKNPPVGE
jgi:small subunit ribosomal protein S2